MSRIIESIDQALRSQPNGWAIAKIIEGKLPEEKIECLMAFFRERVKVSDVSEARLIASLLIGTGGSLCAGDSKKRIDIMQRLFSRMSFERARIEPFSSLVQDILEIAAEEWACPGQKNNNLAQSFFELILRHGTFLTEGGTIAEKAIREATKTKYSVTVERLRATLANLSGNPKDEFFLKIREMLLHALIRYAAPEEITDMVAVLIPLLSYPIAPSEIDQPTPAARHLQGITLKAHALSQRVHEVVDPVLGIRQNVRIDLCETLDGVRVIYLRRFMDVNLATEHYFSEIVPALIKQMAKDREAHKGEPNFRLFLEFQAKNGGETIFSECKSF